MSDEYPVIRLIEETYELTVSWIDQAISSSSPAETVRITRDGNKIIIIKGEDQYQGAAGSVICCYGIKMMDGKIEGRCRAQETGVRGGPLFREYRLGAIDNIDLNSRFALAALYGSGKRVLLFYDKIEGGREVLVREEFDENGVARKETCIPLKEFDTELLRRCLKELESSSQDPSLIDLAAELRMTCDFYDAIKPFLACHGEESYTSHTFVLRGPGPRLTFRFLSIGVVTNLRADRRKSLENLRRCLGKEFVGWRQ